jgi:hypothetical protein
MLCVVISRAIEGRDPDRSRGTRKCAGFNISFAFTDVRLLQSYLFHNDAPEKIVISNGMKWREKSQSWNQLL